MENMVKVSRKETKGSIWNEIGKTKVTQILISHGNNEINAIQFVYVVDEKVVPSKMHGEPCGSNFDLVTFDYPNEYLVSVSGEYNFTKLASIAFSTNIRKYGPFGSKDNSGFEKFAYNFRQKFSFGGFHGSVFNSCVSAIGIYVKPLKSLVDQTNTDTGAETAKFDLIVANKRVRGL